MSLEYAWVCLGFTSKRARLAGSRDETICYRRQLGIGDRAREGLRAISVRGLRPRPRSARAHPRSEDRCRWPAGLRFASLFDPEPRPRCQQGSVAGCRLDRSDRLGIDAHQPHQRSAQGHRRQWRGAAIAPYRSSQGVSFRWRRHGRSIGNRLLEGRGSAGRFFSRDECASRQAFHCRPAVPATRGRPISRTGSWRRSSRRCRVSAGCS